MLRAARASRQRAPANAARALLGALAGVDGDVFETPRAQAAAAARVLGALCEAYLGAGAAGEDADEDEAAADATDALGAIGLGVRVCRAAGLAAAAPGAFEALLRALHAFCARSLARVTADAAAAAAAGRRARAHLEAALAGGRIGGALAAVDAALGVWAAIAVQVEEAALGGCVRWGERRRRERSEPRSERSERIGAGKGKLRRLRLGPLAS